MAKNLRQSVSTNQVCGEGTRFFRNRTGNRRGVVRLRSPADGWGDSNRNGAEIWGRHQRIAGISRKRRTAVVAEGIAFRKIKACIRCDDHLLPANALTVAVVEEFQAHRCWFPSRYKIE